MIGPHQSIICSFTGTGHGAAAWIAISSDDRSYLLRSLGGSLSMRLNIVGTSWLCVTWYFSISAQVVLGIEVLHDDHGAAHAGCVSDTAACGAEWYSGAGDR